MTSILSFSPDSLQFQLEGSDESRSGELIDCDKARSIFETLTRGRILKLSVFERWAIGVEENP